MLYQQLVALLWGDRPDDAPAIDLPWAEVMSSERAMRMPKKTAACFLAYLQGEPTWDDHGRLPVYERAEFFSIDGAVKCRTTMLNLRKTLKGTEVPSIIDFDTAEVVS